MDDMIILSDNKEFLHWLEKKIYDYLQDNLKLTLKSTWQVFPIKDRGIDFIGYRIFPDFTLLRKYNVKNFKSAMGRIERKIETGQELTYHDYCSFNSYLGWLKPCDPYRLKEKYMKPLEISLIVLFIFIKFILSAIIVWNYFSLIIIIII